MSQGRLEVITGPMFSGKSEELIRRLRRAVIARQFVMSFKPTSDIRYHPTDIVSHSHSSLKAIPVATVIDLYDHINSVAPMASQVIGIDEAQFFDDKLHDICLCLIERGKRVIVAGLDTDFQGEPFTPMPNLMAIADEVTKLSAVCIKCGGVANHTYRLDKSNRTLVSVGALEAYEARCRNCFTEKEN